MELGGECGDFVGVGGAAEGVAEAAGTAGVHVVVVVGLQEFG